MGALRFGPWAGTPKTTSHDVREGELLQDWAKRSFGKDAFVTKDVNTGRAEGERMEVVGYLMTPGEIWAVRVP